MYLLSGYKSSTSYSKLPILNFIHEVHTKIMLIKCQPASALPSNNTSDNSCCSFAVFSILMFYCSHTRPLAQPSLCCQLALQSFQKETYLQFHYLGSKTPISLQLMISLVANTLPVVLRHLKGYRQAQNKYKKFGPSLFLSALFGDVHSMGLSRKQMCFGKPCSGSTSNHEPDNVIAWFFRSVLHRRQGCLDLKDILTSYLIFRSLYTLSHL